MPYDGHSEKDFKIEEDLNTFGLLKATYEVLNITHNIMIVSFA